MFNEKQLKCHENSPEGKFSLFIFQIIYFFFKICTYSCDVFKSRSWDIFDPSVAPREDNPQDSDSNSAAAGKKKDYILYLKYLSSVLVKNKKRNKTNELFLNVPKNETYL